MGDDRRFYKRYEKSIPLTIYFDNKEYIGQTSNISEEGICFISDKEFNLGNNLMIVLFDPDIRKINKEYGPIVNIKCCILRKSAIKNSDNSTTYTYGCKIYPQYNLFEYIKTLEVLERIKSHKFCLAGGF